MNLDDARTAVNLQTEPTPESAEDPPPAAEDPVDTPAPAPVEATPLEALAAERDRLAQEKTALQDLLLRRQADYDNFRKRAERERTGIQEYASLQAVEALLGVLDDFERARGAADDHTSVSAYAKGIDLIYQRFLDTLTRLGLEPIASAGAKFDPNLHNAIQREERDDVDDQTVIAEFQRGYTFKGRLLRPAMVKVAVKP